MDRDFIGQAVESLPTWFNSDAHYVGNVCKKCGSYIRLKSNNKCKKCRDQYRQANAQKIKQTKKQYYQANAQKIKQYHKQYRQANAQKIKQTKKQYYQANAQKIKQTKKQYRQQNKDKSSAQSAKRRATKLSATPSWADHTTIKEIYKQRQELSELDNTTFHVDHIIPLKATFNKTQVACGLHVHYNLQVITQKQNLSKNAYTWPDMWEYNSITPQQWKQFVQEYKRTLKQEKK